MPGTFASPKSRLGSIPAGILCEMNDVTTIKVPRSLRDRLAVHARIDDIPLATVIEKALDVSEERAFWDEVRSSNASLVREEPGDRESQATLRDDLDDAGDDAISEAGAW